MNSIKQAMKNFFLLLKEIFKHIRPKSKTETFILLGFILFYFSYSIFIIMGTSLIDTKYTYDVLFSFDHPSIFKQGMEHWSSHPLLVFIMGPVILIGNILALLGGLKAKTLFICAICNLLVSLSVMYIFRYLREIVELKKGISLFLTVFFGLFSTNLILSFTPESYTISTFLLTFSIYYYSYHLKADKKVPFGANLGIAILLGGVTITNFIKGIIPMFFQVKERTRVIKNILIISSVLAVILIFLVFSRNILGEFIIRMQLFTGTLPEGAFFKNVVDLFWGGPLLFPEITTRWLEFGNMKYWGITTLYYESWWQYLFIAILTFLLCVSIVKNYKNQLVILISLLLLVDILIHVVFQFGLVDPIIYGGHWVYCIPLLLGWLYKSTDFLSRKIVSITFVCLFGVLAINNFICMYDLIAISFENFPLQDAYEQVGLSFVK